MSRIRLLFLIPFLLVMVSCTSLMGIGGPITAESEETQGVIVDGVPSLTVEHFGGTVTVRDGEPGRISADLTRHSRLDDVAEAQAQLDKIVMTFTQTGNEVTLTVEYQEDLGEPLSLPSADLELLVPPGTMLDINQGAGDLTVEQPSGDVTVNLGAGNATVTLPEEASFHLIVAGGVADVNSDFPGVPSGGVASDIDTTIGSDPTQTLNFNLGAGDINLRHAP